MRRIVLFLVTAFMFGGFAASAARGPMAATPLSREDLAWWHQRHAAKLAELAQKHPTLIFLGDSITQQWENGARGDFPSYIPAWGRFYGDRNAVNLGFTGDATAHLLWRIQNGEVAGIAPKVAVVLIGANNLGKVHWGSEDTLTGIEAVTKELRRRLPTTHILLLSVLPSERTAWATRMTLLINQGLAQRYPAGGDVTFLDVTHAFMKEGRINRDMFLEAALPAGTALLHPSLRGQIALSEAIEPTLAKLLGDRPHK